MTHAYTDIGNHLITKIDSTPSHPNENLITVLQHIIRTHIDVKEMAQP
jgi:hypothetical protein